MGATYKLGALAERGQEYAALFLPGWYLVGFDPGYLFARKEGHGTVNLPFDVVEHALNQPRVVGQMECHTPACGYVRGNPKARLADVVQHGRLFRLMCQRCCGNWAILTRELEALKKEAV